MIMMRWSGDGGGDIGSIGSSSGGCDERV